MFLKPLSNPRTSQPLTIQREQQKMQSAPSSLTTPSNNVLWARCLESLKHEVPEVQFNTWVRPLTAVDDHRAFVLRAPNRFIRDFVEEKYSQKISACLASLGSPGNQLPISVISGQDTALSQPGITDRAPSSSVLKNGEPRMTYFDMECLQG